MKFDLKDQKNFHFVQITDGINGIAWDSNSKEKRISLTLQPNEMIWVCSPNEKTQIEIDTGFPTMDIGTSESILLVHPKSEWQVDISDHNRTTMCFVIELKTLHELLVADYREDKLSDYTIDYSQISKVISLSPKVLNALASVFSNANDSPFHHIEIKGNFLLAFSTLMEKLFGNKAHSCPFQMNRETEEKIRFVRNNIVNNLNAQPDVLKLSFEVNIPKTILKQGFQHVYGKSIHNFYHDYRMDKAISLLENGQHLVKEIAFKIGYQNPSHFIAAFKKRNGCTPKQYMKNY